MLDAIYSDMLCAAGAFGKQEADMVFGEGDPTAHIMLIGEAPGAEETRLRRPFVGKAGKNLDEFLVSIGLERADIYITNVVKFRPYKVSARGTLSNRPPKSGEIACMRKHLMREIAAVAPSVVVTLGNVPLKCVLNDSKATIGAYHARPTDAGALSHTFKLFPLYHPASIIYNRALKDVYHADLLALKAFIDTSV